MDWRTKGLWLPDEPVTVADLAGRPLFDGPFSWPVMVARGSAIESNIATMAAYCARHGVDLAPHGKTTMARKLIDAQLRAGAWGVTVATPNQALVMRRWGVPRVLLANELLDERVLGWAAEQVAGGWEFISYVDSVEGVAALREVPGRAQVLIEVGYRHGRTGCRTVAEAVEVARAAAAVDGVEVLGVAGFEGQLSTVDEVRAFLGVIREASRAIGGPVVSVGGSSYFDLVIAELHGVTERLILRSGCYAIHDHGLYAAANPFTRVPAEGFLLPALEVWAPVLSAPEPGVVIAGAGRRDLPHDSGLPVPLKLRDRDGGQREVAEGGQVERLSDQHAHLRGVRARPGELICLGISHPCTAFDKWRVIPVVDDDYRVVDVIETSF